MVCQLDQRARIYLTSQNIDSRMEDTLTIPLDFGQAIDC